MKRQPSRRGRAAVFALALPVLAALTPIVVGCHRQAPPAADRAEGGSAAADASGNVAASRFTAAANAAVASALPIADAADFEEARRGLVATEPDLVIRAADARTVWRPRDYAFVEGEAPASVNPSLWRQARLNMEAGLFTIAERIRVLVEEDPFRFEKHKFSLTISLGVAVAEAFTPTSYEQLREVAAEAEKEAKGTGRNKAVIRVIPPPPAG